MRLKVSLWDAASRGGPVGSTLTRSKVALSEGRFTVADLDFGPVFYGEARWLEVAVKCGDDSSYTALEPRQALTAPGGHVTGRALERPGAILQPRSLAHKQGLGRGPIGTVRRRRRVRGPGGLHRRVCGLGWSPRRGRRLGR